MPEPKPGKPGLSTQCCPYFCSMLSPLTALSPIDGRYHGATAPLSAYFSELALMRYRVLIEVEYFIALAEVPLTLKPWMNTSGGNVDLRRG